MSKDIFGGLGGGLGELMKGLSGFMPQDDPNMQILNAQTEVNDLSKQEAELYSEIGKRAVEVYGLEPFAELSGKLKLVQINLATAKSKLNSLQAVGRKVLLTQIILLRLRCGTTTVGSCRQPWISWWRNSTTRKERILVLLSM
jgi:hypothetical protein